MLIFFLVARWQGLDVMVCGELQLLLMHVQLHVVHVLKKMPVVFVKVMVLLALIVRVHQMVMPKQIVLAHAKVMLSPIVLVHVYLAL